MTEETWTAVDDYIDDMLIGADEALTLALIDAERAGLMAINVAPAHGKLLQILALGIRAKAILEVGTLGGYSTIWLGRALPPDGKLVTLEINPEAAAVARRNISRAGLDRQVSIIVGPAMDSLNALPGPFDFVFIDANKDEADRQFLAALDRTRSGGLIVVDNVVREGRVLNAGDNVYVDGIRRLYEVMKSDPRVVATAIQTVGVKGYDGFAIAAVK